MEGEPKEKETDLLFEIAIGRNQGQPGLERRVAVEAIWREMANGTAAPHERDEWLSHISKCIVSQVIDNPAAEGKGKGSAALIAIGLHGRRVDDSELLRALDTLTSFADLFIPHRKMTQLEKVRSLRPGGHFRGLTDREAVRKIENVVRNRLPKEH